MQKSEKGLHNDVLQPLYLNNLSINTLLPFPGSPFINPGFSREGSNLAYGFTCR